VLSQMAQSTPRPKVRVTRADESAHTFSCLAALITFAFVVNGIPCCPTQPALWDRDGSSRSEYATLQWLGPPRDLRG
jgi:hypothetical protein